MREDCVVVGFCGGRWGGLGGLGMEEAGEGGAVEGYACSEGGGKDVRLGLR